MTFEGGDPERQLVRDQLAEIGRSEVFVTSPRLTRLLSYLVEAVLAGQGGQLNQTRIALDVMERDASFDPTTNSSVRVEAGRLRAKLREYYGDAGAADRVRFELPKGRYNPDIVFANSARAGPDSGALKQVVRFCRARDESSIAWARSGEGPPMIKAANWLSHLEFDCTSPVWGHWWRELSARFSLIRNDERGCGLSDWEVDDFSFDAWVSDLECVVDAAEVDRFALLGISQGAAVAARYAIDHPDRVSHLILYGAFAQGRMKRAPDQSEEARMLEDLVSLGWGRPDPAFRRIFASLFAPDAGPAQLAAFDELQRASTSPANARRFIELFNRIGVGDLLPRVDVPTLVLHARDEAEMPIEHGRLFASTIPGARFKAVDSRNHILGEDEPAWRVLLDEIDGFLADG